MNELTIFKNEDFGEIRTVLINDEPEGRNRNFRLSKCQQSDI